MNGEDVWQVMLLGGVVVLLAVMGVRSCQDAADWEVFKADHHCIEIGEMTGGYKTSSKVGYRCDDGKEYWR